MIQASPASNMGTPASKQSGKWSKSKTVKKLMSMKECTSIVDGLKYIYFTKVRAAVTPTCHAHPGSDAPSSGNFPFTMGPA